MACPNLEVELGFLVFVLGQIKYVTSVSENKSKLFTKEVIQIVKQNKDFNEANVFWGTESPHPHALKFLKDQNKQNKIIQTIFAAVIF